MKLGNKILVVGVSASGKSVFSRELGGLTGIPVTYIDALMWKPGWNYIGREENARLVNEASKGSQWIIEGFILKECLPTVLGNADSIIYLDYSRVVTAWRYIKRYFQHRKNPRPELDGSPDKFSLSFLIKILKKKEVYYLNKFLKEDSNRAKLIRLTSPAMARELLRNASNISGR